MAGLAEEVLEHLLQDHLAQVRAAYAAAAGKEAGDQGDEFLNIWSRNSSGKTTLGWSTAPEAMLHPSAYEIHARGKLILVRVQGVWCRPGGDT